MGLLTGNVQDKSIAERSNDILGIFKSAAEDLNSINQEAELTIEMNSEIIAEKNAENQELRDIGSRNEAIIDGIRNLIGK